MDEARIIKLLSSGLLIIGGKVGTVSAAGVEIDGIRDLAARVLPQLAAVVPMEAKLGQFSGNLAWLLAVELNPNPLPNYFCQFPKAGRLRPQQVQHSFQRQTAVILPQGHINGPKRGKMMCGPVLEL